MIDYFLTKNSLKKKSFDKITSISFEANQFKKENPKKNIIDGTIGMFYGEDEKPYVFPVIKNIYDSLSLIEVSKYGFLYPTTDFIEGTYNLLGLEKKYQEFCSVFPCSGGLNAIHHLSHSFIDNSIETYTLNPYWGPYQNIFGELGFKISSIEMQPSKDFSLSEDLIYDSIIKSKKNKIFLMMNIPCHNPTGFSPDINELKNIKNAINKLIEKGKKILLFFDLVYIHYSNININTIFDIFYDISFLFNFSTSKTLSLYGFRTGAICLYSKQKKDRDLFIDKMAFSARASTGSINHLGYKIIEKFSNNLYIESLKNSWDIVKKNLQNRANKFLQILNKNNLNYYRYNEGFFISFFDNKNIENLNAKLKEEGIFFVPQKDSIRAAISSIPLLKIDDFGNRIDKIFSKKR